MQQYNHGEYKKAVVAFEKVLYEKPSNETVKLYLGVCYLAMEQYEKAEIQLSQLNRESSMLQPTAQWYLVMTYLKSGENKAAIELLKTLSGTDQPYQEKAKAILQKLD